MTSRSPRVVGFFLAATCFSAVALAEPPVEYVELNRTAQGARAALERAPDDARDALQAFAIDSDLALIEWLDAFIETEAFAWVDADEQAVYLEARVATELDLTRLFVDVERCEEAHERLDHLARRPFAQPWAYDLAEALEQTVICVPATLVVRAFPENAELVVDGVPMGSASAPIELAIGDHEVRIEAPGYRTVVREVTLDVPGGLVEIGPIYLTDTDAPIDRSALPRWYEWTLWGVGSASVGVGVGYILGATDNRSQLDLTFRERSNDEFVDAQTEEADSLDVLGWVFIGAGIASIGSGTYLYVHRQLTKYVAPEAESRAPSWYEWTLWGVAGAGLGWGASALSESFHRHDFADALGSEIGDDTPGVEGLRERADDLVIKGAIITAAAVTIALVGIASYVIRTTDPEGPQGGQIEVEASLGPETGGLLVTVPF